MKQNVCPLFYNLQNRTGSAPISRICLALFLVWIAGTLSLHAAGSQLLHRQFSVKWRMIIAANNSVAPGVGEGLTRLPRRFSSRWQLKDSLFLMPAAIRTLGPVRFPFRWIVRTSPWSERLPSPPVEEGHMFPKRSGTMPEPEPIPSSRGLIGVSQGLGIPSGFINSSFTNYPVTPSIHPVLTVTTPNQTTITQPSITLLGTATDVNGVVSVVANGVPATTSDAFAHWSATLTSLPVGLTNIIVSATDGAISPNSTTVTRQILYYTSTSSLFGNGLPDAWKIANGLNPFSNTGVNGATGNPSGDGISNLLKYAINLNPQQKATTGLPFTSTALNLGDGRRYLIFNYRRIIGGGGVTYSVEASTDLVHWDSLTADVVEISSTPDLDGVTNDVRVRVLPWLGTLSPGHKFVRLRVTAPCRCRTVLDFTYQPGR